MKSPITGAGVMRRRGRGPLHGFILGGGRDNRSPTNDNDAAREAVPLAFQTGTSDIDLARSDNLQDNSLTFNSADLGHDLDSAVGKPISTRNLFASS
jgi:hypothetical protein